MDKKELTNYNKSLFLESKKYCTGCKTVLHLDDFVVDNKKHDGRRSKCRYCRNKQRQVNRVIKNQQFIKYENLPEVKRRQRSLSLKRQYGILLGDYEKMLQQQEGVCKICKNPETHRHKKNLSVDHCHSEKKVRGLLCHKCNVALGLLNDDIEIITNMINYLKESKL